MKNTSYLDAFYIMREIFNKDGGIRLDIDIGNEFVPINVWANCLEILSAMVKIEIWKNPTEVQKQQEHRMRMPTLIWFAIYIKSYTNNW